MIASPLFGVFQSDPVLFDFPSLSKEQDGKGCARDREESRPASSLRQPCR